MTLRSSLNRTGRDDTKSILKNTTVGLDAGNTLRTVDFKSESGAGATAIDI